MSERLETSEAFLVLSKQKSEALVATKHFGHDANKTPEQREPPIFEDDTLKYRRATRTVRTTKPYPTLSIIVQGKPSLAPSS